MKHARPWFRKQTNSWYICRNGKQEYLGGHPPKAPKPHKKSGHWNAPKEILDAYHKLMGDESPKNPRAVRLKHVINHWLDDHKTLASYAWFKAFLSRSSKVF